MMAQEDVVSDALRITGVLIKHSQEIPDCNHSIKEIIKEALGLASTSPEPKAAATNLRNQLRNGYGD